MNDAALPTNGALVASHAPPTPMEILSAAVAGGATVETLKELMALQERWQRNEARKAFDEALSAAKAEMPSIRKNRRVDYEHKGGGGRTNYTFEDLAEIAETVNPILAKYGLSYRWRTESPHDAPVKVTCVVSHSMGHSEENTLEGPRDTSGQKNGLQAIGSTVTFLQRYTLKAALGLVTKEDDDGRAAGAPMRREARREAVPPRDKKVDEEIAKFVAQMTTGFLNCDNEDEVEAFWKSRAEKIARLTTIDPDTVKRLETMRTKRIADFTGEVIDDA